MRTSTGRRALLSSLLVGGLLGGAACGQQLTQPTPQRTLPRASVTGGSSAGTPIEWAWIAAGPPGNCMADRLNLEMPATVWPTFTVVVRKNGSSVTLEFSPDLEDDIGLLPSRYEGQLIDGHLQAFAPLWPNAFVDPYRKGVNPTCYISWTIAKGELTATVEPDGRLSGVVEDTYRAVPSGDLFTVKTTFKTLGPVGL